MIEDCDRCVDSICHRGLRDQRPPGNLARLPSDINDLYNSLWARRPENPRKKGGYALAAERHRVLAYKLARGVACR